MANDLNIRLVLDGNQFRAELKNSRGEVERFATDSARGGAAATSAFQGVRGAASSLRNVLGGISVALLVRELGQMADTAANMRGRLALVTSGTEELAGAQSALFSIAQRTSTSLESTTTLYTRMAAALREAGASQGEMLGVTQTITQAIAVSGASSAEASSAILQLSQAMAAGALRGEEFNSVNEAAPRIMQALASSMGVSRGELRKLAEEGKITTSELRRAFSGEQAAQIASEFEQLPLTISRAFTQLSNAMLQFVGDADSTSQASTAVASVISALAQAVELLGPFINDLAIAWTGNSKAQLDVASTGRDIANAFKVVVTGLVLAKNAVDVLVDGFSFMVRAATSAVSAIIETFETSGASIDRLVAALKNPFDDLTVADAIEQNMADGTAILARFMGEMREHGQQFSRDLDANISDVADAFEAANKPLGEVNRTLLATGTATGPATRSLAEHGKTADKVKVSAASLVRALADLRAMAVDYTGVSEPMRAALEANAREAADLTRITALLTAAGKDSAEVQALIAAATRNVTDAAAERLDQARREEDVVGALNASYAEQVRLAGMSEAQRRVEIASIAAITAHRDAHRGQIDAETEALIRQTVEAGEAQVALAEEARRSAEASSRAWGDFAQGLARAVLDGSRGVKRYFKQLLDDLKAQIIASGLMRLFSSIFNVGGSGSGASSLLGAMFGGSGGNSGAFSFGNIVSAFGGGSGGTGNSLLSNLFSAQSWARAGQQLAGGFTQMFGGAGNVSALQSYGVLNTPTGMAGGFAGHGGLAGWGGAAAGALYGYGRGDGGVGTAASTVAGGVAGYYAGGTMAAFASGGTAAGGAAMASIPVAGWVAAAALAIDALSGGRLFGTRYRPESSESTLSVGDAGGDASMSIREVRQRSLFRGRRWRTRDVDAGDEAQAAADQLYDAIYGVMADSARALSIDTPPMIDAAIRTVVEYDKKGKAKATKIFVDVLGRTWEEASAELAASRLSSEALIATIDAALGTTVEAAMGTIGDGIDGAAPRIRDRFGEMIAGVIPKEEEGTQTVGEASAIAERWRHDAELLAAGAQFLLLAATDIRRGVGLLGEEGGLTEVTDLIEELQGAGESLAQTYGRVAASAALFDQLLGISGQQLDQTREAFVRWSTGIVDAAGGLDRATSLVASYVDRYFTAAERAQYALSQATVAGQREFGDIGLDLNDFTGEGGMARLRELFESGLANMTEATVAEWLEALAVLAAVTDAQAAYNQVLAEGEAEAAAAAAELAEFMGRIREGAADAALQLREWDLSPLERQLGAVARETQANVVAARRMGATEAELAEIRAAGAAQAELVTRQAADDLAELLGGLRFDDALAGMSQAEQQAARLNAQFDGYIAQAIALGASEEQLAEIREIQARAIGRLGESTRQAADSVNALAGAINGLDQLNAGFAGVRTVNDLLSEARTSVLGDGLTESQRAIRDVNARFDELVGQAAAQLQAARTADSLGIGDYRLTEQIAAAIAELESLRLTAIARIHEEAAERERQLLDQRYRRESQWIERLLGLRDSLALDSQLSTLTPAERMQEAQRQYDAAIAAIQAASLTEGTDDDDRARAAYDSVARQLLTEGRDFWGSAEQYDRLRDQVLGDIDRFVAGSTAAIGQQVIAAAQIVIPDGAVQLDMQPVTSGIAALRADQDEQTVALIEEQRATRRELEAMRQALREIASNTRQTGGKVRVV